MCNDSASWSLSTPMPPPCSQREREPSSKPSQWRSNNKQQHKKSKQPTLPRGTTNEGAMRDLQRLPPPSIPSPEGSLHHSSYTAKEKVQWLLQPATLRLNFSLPTHHTNPLNKSTKLEGDMPDTSPSCTRFLTANTIIISSQHTVPSLSCLGGTSYTTIQSVDQPIVTTTTANTHTPQSIPI
jgi:hypothetical protein